MVTLRIADRPDRLVVGDDSSDARGDMVAWAAATAGRLLADLPDRWLHTQRVATNAWWVAAALTPRDRELLVAAAYLHDIGYAAGVVDTGFHPLDGARYLHRRQQPELARLVAHHSGAAFEARHRGLADQLAVFGYQEGPVADALTYCDVTGGPQGDRVEPGPRFAEIVNRHGPRSVVAQARAEARVQVDVAVVRTLRRVARARPSPHPFTVTPVELECASLLRLEGAFTSAPAPAALRAALGVRAPEQHALVVDLALVASVSSGSAVELMAAGSRSGGRVTLLEPSPTVARTLRTAGIGSTEPTPVATRIADAVVPHSDSA